MAFKDLIRQSEAFQAEWRKAEPEANRKMAAPVPLFFGMR